jgi:DNA-binding response OmpR family regulator
MHEQVLWITDDRNAGQEWAALLAREGLVVDCEVAGQGSGQWEDRAVDLVVVDVASWPDSLALCRQMREQGIGPILLLAAGADPLEAYQAGADEYIPQPISPALLLAKVTAWLHHSWIVPLESLDRLQVGGFCLDPQCRQLVTPAGDAVRLTNLEFRLLHLLMSHPGQGLDVRTIVSRIWGDDRDRDDVLRHLVARLQFKIEPTRAAAGCIRAAGEKGYRFEPDSYGSAAWPR